MCPGRAPACSARPPLTSPGWTLSPGRAAFSVSSPCPSAGLQFLLGSRGFVITQLSSSPQEGVGFLSIACTHSHPAVCLFMCLVCFVSGSEWVRECIYTPGCLFSLWMTSHDWQVLLNNAGVDWTRRCVQKTAEQHPKQNQPLTGWGANGPWNPVLVDSLNQSYFNTVCRR